MKTNYFFAVLLCLFCFKTQAQWIDFVEETSTRINVVNISDNTDNTKVDDQEKDLAVGDFNNDGFTDLVVVRKTPFSSAGGKTDLLFMNENGVLEDKTDVYAPAFLSSSTDARDIICVDVNKDTWLDLFIINTFEDQPKLFINQGEDTNGNWLGFIDESSTRLPTITVNPIQFCAGWSGDLTGNTYPDLFMVNYDPFGNALDALLINDGTGVFTEETQTRMGDLRNSSFGTGVEFHDIDNDNDLDIIKNLGLNNIAPFNTKGTLVLFNNGAGTFTNWHRLPGPDPYMFTAGDLNDNGFLDFYLVDDAADYIDKITSVTIDQSVTVTQQSMATNRTDGFGGNVKMVDLDGDGDLDIGLSSVDTDLPPCETPANRRFIIFENENLYSGNIIHPYGSTINAWNVSTYDHDYIDINNDGLMDIILGACDDYKIFMQVNPALSVEEDTLDTPFSLHPNPSNGNITINLGAIKNDTVTLDIYTIEGRKITSIEKQNIDSSFTLDLKQQLQTGVYFIKFKTDTATFTKKIIIE
ncbi:T9SS type A sorting domain-containing protein [uncultured Lacinutrix sp.]|uniref:T9SS type A sorting domain-containing protein n=1 Tax=uncultured Lacinutrix sp. TaxID=574032 RepID=UPI0026272419|nr:T9SS type A sorting domain-containing protein [uncultured Lacinutrix sp.]